MVKVKAKEFVAVDPSKCTGCSLCEYVCALTHKEQPLSPLRSRLRVIRVTPAFNLAMACRFCDDAPCVEACPRDALTQSEENGRIMITEAKCDGCGWCVQACPYGGVSVHPDKTSVLICDLCENEGKPQCVEFCPEEALELVSSDQDANKKLAAAIQKLPIEAERIAKIAKEKAWDSLLAEAEERAKRLSEKLEAIDKKWGVKLKL
ncbi:4Fe-4S dicluster domain-containing protein [Candidatus Bathyarchaeota archaeon]|nr:4Fe-4S dicluster domain-containing protein [Candidatus Bathyarchaeota archaeon]